MSILISCAEANSAASQTRATHQAGWPGRFPRAKSRHTGKFRGGEERCLVSVSVLVNTSSGKTWRQHCGNSWRALAGPEFDEELDAMIGKSAEVHEFPASVEAMLRGTSRTGYPRQQPQTQRIGESV